MDRSQFILFIEPGRPDMPDSPTEVEQTQVGEHFNYLKEQLALGNLILAGRTTEPPYIGIAIFEAEDEAAAAELAENDPGIRSGVFRLTRIQPYRVALIRT